MNVRIQIWIAQICKVQRSKLMKLLQMGGQYEHVEKRITRFEIADKNIQILQYNIESA